MFKNTRNRIFVHHTASKNLKNIEMYIYNIIKTKFVIIRYLGTYTVKKKLCNRIETNETGHNDLKHLGFIHEFETCCNIYFLIYGI